MTVVSAVHPANAAGGMDVRAVADERSSVTTDALPAQTPATSAVTVDGATSEAVSAT